MVALHPAPARGSFGLVMALVPDHELWRATPVFELDDNGVRRFLDLATPARIERAVRAVLAKAQP